VQDGFIRQRPHVNFRPQPSEVLGEELRLELLGNAPNPWDERVSLERSAEVMCQESFDTSQQPPAHGRASGEAPHNYATTLANLFVRLQLAQQELYHSANAAGLQIEAVDTIRLHLNVILSSILRGEFSESLQTNMERQHVHPLPDPEILQLNQRLSAAFAMDLLPETLSSDAGATTTRTEAATDEGDSEKENNHSAGNTPERQTTGTRAHKRRRTNGTTPQHATPDGPFTLPFFPGIAPNPRQNDTNGDSLGGQGPSLRGLFSTHGRGGSGGSIF